MRRFVLISQPRSGTWLLRNGLRQHPRVHMATELFNPQGPVVDKRHWQERWTTAQILERLAWPRQTAWQAAGFLLHLDQPWTEYRPRYGDVWDLLHKDKEVVFILLQRQNLLERFVSKQLAEKTRIWHVALHASPPQVEPFTASYEQILGDMNACLSRRQQFLMRFRGRQIHRVTYEDLVADFSRTCRQTQEFLGLDPVKVEPTLQKQTRQTPAELLTNYPLLKSRFAKTQFASHFRW